MRLPHLAVALGLAFSIASPGSAFAQSVPGGQEAATSAPTRQKAARTKREPTAGQMVARERQRKCGAEWREAKAANKTGGTKWPQFWSQCNARLKGNSA